MKPLAVFLVALFISGTAMAQDAWRDVESVFNTTGKMLDSRTMLIEMPRSDQTVMRGDTKLAPEFGLTSEIKFTGRPEKAHMMAELVLLEKEVEPVITQLLAGGFEITALHNHFLGTDPHILFLHVAGDGGAKGLATALKTALGQTGMPMGGAAASAPSTPSAQWNGVQSALGHRGQQKGDVLEVLLPRKDKVTLKGMSVPPFFGAAHHLLFQKAGDKTVAAGELVLLDSEVNPVAKMLKNNRFAITALHNHQLFDNPRLFYLHFWGTDTPENLGRTLRRALELTSGYGAAAAPKTTRGTTPPPAGTRTTPSGATSAPGGTTTTTPSGTTTTPSGTTTTPPSSGTTYPLPGGTPPIPRATTPKR